MTIRIEITDPHLLPSQALHKLAIYLFANVHPAIEFKQPDPIAIIPPEGNLEIKNNGDIVNPFLKAGAMGGAKAENVGRGEMSKVTGFVSPELDSAGFPWDERINAKNKSKKADGTWRGGRGANPSKIKKVQNELRAAGFSTTIQPEVNTSAAAPAPSVPKAEEDNFFNDFMSRLLELSKADKLNPGKVIAAVQSVGLKETLDLSQRPDLIPQVLAIIEREAA